MNQYTHELVMPNSDLMFRMFRFEGMNGNYQVLKHWHHSVEIFSVISGEIQFQINSKIRPLGEGHAMIVNSNQLHSIYAPKENNIVVIQIPFSFFQEYCDGGYIYFRQEEKGDHQKIRNLVIEMYQQYMEKAYGYQSLLMSSFYQLIYLLVTRYKTKGIGEELIVYNDRINQLSKITDYMKEHHNDNLTLGSVAETFGFSSTYLSRYFQKNAGVNFKTYLQNVRVGFAYKELMNTHNNIGEIALNNGFANIKSFTAEFKKRYGVVPSQFRKDMN